MDAKKATSIGLLSVIFWSANVGLIRMTTEALGPVGGLAMLYTASTILLYFSFGFPKLSEFPRTYLILASLLFCVYELCFSLSLGYANDGRQTLEVGMVNYLWPSLTILMAIVFNGQRANWLVFPGMMMALVGIGFVLGGDEGLQLGVMWENVLTNPLSYGLAFAGAFFWSIYCTITARIGGGKNGITFFFILTAAILWVKYLTGDNPPITPSLHALVITVFAAAALAFGYATWNIGILHGNVTFLSAASYLIPVVSCMITAFLVGETLTLTFWKGCGLTTCGSFLCWLSTKLVRPKPGVVVPDAEPVYRNDGYVRNPESVRIIPDQHEASAPPSGSPLPRQSAE